MSEGLDEKWIGMRSEGWYIERKGGRVRLLQQWWPLNRKTRLPEDRDDGRSFTREIPPWAFWRCCQIGSRFQVTRGHGPNPGSRQLALTILCEVLDWSEALKYLDAFHSDFITGIRLREGERRYIEKATVKWWWLVKEDQREDSLSPVYV